MINQYGFYYSKSKIKKKLIKNLPILILIILVSFVSLINLQSVPLTTFILVLAPFIYFYYTLIIWVQFKYEGALILVSQPYLTLKKLNYVLSFKQVQIGIAEINSIGTEIKMKGDDVVSKSLIIKMLNDEKYSYPMDLMEVTHNDIFNAIKEMNPNIQLINAGDIFIK